MSDAKFVYVTYIRATPQQVWDALLDPKFTRQYWEHDNVSDWKPGSQWQHRRLDGKTVDVVGKVVESSPPSHLVLTWADPANAGDPKKYSRVTFTLETVDEMLRLTVAHEELDAGTEMTRKISSGWPRVLSSLKSMLETGKPLPTWAKRGND